MDLRPLQKIQEMSRLDDPDHAEVFEREQVLAVAGDEVACASRIGGLKYQVIRVLIGDDFDGASGFIKIGHLKNPFCRIQT